LTKEFLDKNAISNASNVIDWLAEHGGFCDCEILINVDQLFEYLTPTQKPLFKSESKGKKLDSLKTECGFRFSKVPSPWILTEVVTIESKAYSFQIGKSNNCVVGLIKSVPTHQLTNDEYWTKRWINETELNYNLEHLSAERLKIKDYLAILVKAKNWTPVRIWCIKNEVDGWYLKMATALSRYKGDIKELEKLLSSIS
jgi:hypothetical protein